MKLRALRELRRVGHMPTLFAGLLHFEVSFATWVLLGVLAPTIRTEISVSPALSGLVVGVPFAASSLCRIVVGYLSDRLGPRRVGTVTMLMVAVPLAYGAMFTDTAAELIAISALLGLAGASFAVALPLAAGAVPVSHRGLALGIAGAGNSGTVLAGLFAPRLANVIGWHGVLGGAAVLVVVTAVVFRAMARESTLAAPQPFRRAVRSVAGADLVRLSALYLTTFGTYVGLAAFLPTMLVNRYGVTPVTAGFIAAAAAGTGSLLRPIGGGLADRFGGPRIVGVVLVVASAWTLAAAAASTVTLAALAACGLLGTLGAGNGAVFQVVGSRFAEGVGTATGIVGAAGGLGGFLVPTVLGSVHAATGSYVNGLIAGSIFILAMLVALARVRVHAAFPVPRLEDLPDAA